MNFKHNVFNECDPEVKSYYTAQVRKITALGHLYSEVGLDENGKPFNLNIDTWVGKVMAKMDIIALLNLLVKKNIISADDFLKGSAALAAQFMALQGQQTRLIFADDGNIIKRDEKGGLHVLTIGQLKEGLSAASGESTAPAATEAATRIPPVDGNNSEDNRDK